jgi:hypothetical protein
MLPVLMLTDGSTVNGGSEIVAWATHASSSRGTPHAFKTG